MKTFLILFASIFIVSCSTHDDFVNETDAILHSVDAKEILKNLERDLNASRPEFNIKFESSEVIKIDEVYYLRAVSGEYISTTLLEKDSKGMLFSRGISCTSSVCANTDGCIPTTSGKSCTSCGGGIGDCTKTVSTGNLPYE